LTKSLKGGNKVRWNNFEKKASVMCDMEYNGLSWLRNRVLLWNPFENSDKSSR